MSDKLIKIDKNGTKYYADNRCPRCGGQGGRDEWVYTGYTCFECGGTGFAQKPYVYKVYTEEYEQKLKSQRAKRAEKRRQERAAQADELNAAFLEHNGFSPEGKVYAVLGDTYPIKDQLKDAGCRFSPLLGWHCNHPLDGYKTLEIDVSELWSQDAAGVYTSPADEGALNVADRIRKANDALKANDSDSEYVGDVGSRIETHVKLVRTYSYTVKFGWETRTNWIYTFSDDNGNVLVWKTSACFDRIVDGRYVPYLEGDELTIRGTVKEHSEYKGVKQTVLQRVKVA